MTSLATRSRLALVALAVAVSLAACATGEDAPVDASPPSGASEPPARTRVVVDIEGTEVEVPEAPRRVVTLSEPTLDGALALAVVPVGTVTGRGQSTVPNYLADLAGDLPLLGGVAQPNYEAIGRARPDLILVDGTSINNNRQAIDVLRQIAPTYYAGYAGGDWRTTFANVADALNLAGEGARVLTDYDTRVAEVAAQLGDYADDTFSIVRWQGSSAALILHELPPGRALQDLGLRRPPNQDRRGRGHSEPVSLENLADIDADHIFFGTLGGSSVDNPTAGGTADVTGATRALADAERTPGFTDLTAYRHDRIILVDGSLWTSTGGPILMRRIVDDVARELLGDVPATPERRRS